MCVITIYFSQPGFMESMVQWTPQFVTNKMDIRGLHSTQGYCYLWYSQFSSTLFKITNWIDICLPPYFSDTMSTNRSRPNTTNMAPTDGLFGLHQCPNGILGVSNHTAGNTPSKATHFRQPTNQFHPLLWYGYLPLQPPFPNPCQFHHPAPFNMTPTS